MYPSYVPRHSSKKFSYDSDTNAFTAWASTLDEGMKKHMFGRIFNDACDEGMYIVSDKTGAEAGFAVDREERNDDNDITSWVLKPTDETKRKFPLLKNATVTIFNT